MTLYPDHVDSSNLERTQPAAAIVAEGEAARRRRDRELTMSERLERVHRLCAQLASLKPIRVKQLS
jgi:hypothetical protein